MMKSIAFLFFLSIPYFLLAQETKPKDDAGQMGGISGFFETYNPVNFPAGANGWWHLLDVRHSNVNNNFAMQFAGSFFDQNLWFRKTNNVPNTEWSRVLTETNGNLNGKLYMLTSGGQNFFTGHQAGGTYSFPGGIFKAITDNPYGQMNVFYEGVAGGVTNFTVRADGQGYFAAGLGIGTQNPAYKLTVAGGDIKAYNFDHNSGVTIGAEAPERPRIGFHASDNSRRFRIEMNSINSDYERLGFFSLNGGQSPEQEVFSINKNGNLGIGTPLPVSKLHIAGDGFITLGSYDTSNGVKGIHFAGFRDVVPNYFGASIEAVPEWLCCGYPGAGYPGIKNIALNFNVHSDPGLADSKLTAMSIRPNGNVGIGTITPEEKFTVNGKIKANEIRVNGSGAPDYVFEPGYKVETLEALESYIKANKHLPEVPSAKEFERDGMAIGEMNKLLLKKIEELTLYIIDGRKQNLTRDRLLLDQKAKITELEQILKAQKK
ncbi:hypothetical protein [Pedobacter zeae]|uniref:Uncharacterized protein n=1 Tax=Pedobacter zeae TaxID=1737356 RepID=A0A7W6K6U6_9SPHI|nr:hypothetical protein [Pedobacter zeae]MBB4106275.1 hypothetical protein [Pedobacter zeae]GGH00649.1 hypothetical protein GCM10007422_14040 [Pedobacter zeae]